MMPTVEVKPEFQRALADHQRVLGRVNAAADHRVDIHVKIGVFGQQLQFPVEHLQALLGDRVRHDVVDRDLQVLQPGAIQPLDAFGRQQVAVGDHAGDHAVLADARDDQVEIGVQQGFAAGDGNDGGAERRQVVQPRVHCVHRNGLREIVKLVAIGARQVAAAHGDDVRQDGMVGGGQPLCNHPELARTPLCGQKCATQLFDLEHTAKTFDYITFRCVDERCVAIGV